MSNTIDVKGHNVHYNGHKGGLMSNILYINDLREKKAKQDFLDMVRIHNEMFDWAMKVGCCPECGALYGNHLTYCVDNGSKSETRHNVYRLPRPSRNIG